MKNLILRLCLLLLLLSTHAWSKEFKVVFINPGHPTGDATGSFWSNVNRFMDAAADDLNIELISLYAERNHLLMKALAESVIEQNPDYVILVNEKGVASELVRSIASDDIPIFLLLNTFNEDEFRQLTDKQNSLIIGSLIPDNFSAGQRLMDDLLAIHKQKSKTPANIHTLALQGDYNSAAAVDRQAGLMASLKANQDVVLLDGPVANWSQQVAYRKVKGLIQRHNIDIIWAANDAMAFGASKAIAEAELDYAVTIGGVNWDRPNASSPIDISYGGHVTLGAKALAMLSDYHMKLRTGCDMHIKINVFKASSDESLRSFHDNTSEKNLDSFDFSRFSKQHAEPATFSLYTFVDKRYQPYNTEDEKSLCNETPTLSH